MPFLLLLLLTVACLPVRWPRPPIWVEWVGKGVLGWFGVSASGWATFLGSTLLTWSSALLLVAVAVVQSARLRRALTRDPARRPSLLQRYVSRRTFHFIALFLIYGLALYVLGWGWVVQGGAEDSDPLADLFPGTELLVLTPLLIGLVLSWLCFYDVERAFHRAAAKERALPPYWSRWAYLAFHARQNLALVFVPLLLLVAVNDIPRLFPEGGTERPIVAGTLTICTVSILFIFMPWIVRLVLGLKPMPASALRTRLESAARRLRFRCSNILIWNTRGGVANAMVIGLVPYVRYVVLTDRLIQEMTPDEVEAVFGHEAGHVKHRHMIYYLLFLMGSLAVLSAIWEASDLEALLNLSSREDLAVLPLLGLLGTYIFVVFGFLSRRCERQADIYGCRAVSCGARDCAGHQDTEALVPGGGGLCPTGIRTFVSALEKVAALNGLSRERPGWLQSWQHSTIARRVEFLQRVLSNPAEEAHFQRRVSLVKWSMFVLLGVLLLLVGLHWSFRRDQLGDAKKVSTLQITVSVG